MFLKSFEGISDETFDKMLTVLKDDEWKNVRTIVTNALTSSKLKGVSLTHKKLSLF